MPGLRHKLIAEMNVKAYLISSLLEPQYRIKFTAWSLGRDIFMLYVI